MPLRSKRRDLSAALAAIAFLVALAFGGCFGGGQSDYGGQSGDEGVDIHDRGAVAASEGAGVGCEGVDADGGLDVNGDAGPRFYCAPVEDGGTGFDCLCDAEHSHSDAVICEDALRASCGVEPVALPDEDPDGPPIDELEGSGEPPPAPGTDAPPPPSA